MSIVLRLSIFNKLISDIFYLQSGKSPNQQFLESHNCFLVSIEKVCCTCSSQMTFYYNSPLVCRIKMIKNPSYFLLLSICLTIQTEHKRKSTQQFMYPVTYQPTSLPNHPAYRPYYQPTDAGPPNYSQTHLSTYPGTNAY